MLADPYRLFLDPEAVFDDTIHPTSLGMGFVTNSFIDTMNDFYGTAMHPLTDEELAALAGIPPAPDCDTQGGYAWLVVLPLGALRRRRSVLGATRAQPWLS